MKIDRLPTYPPTHLSTSSTTYIPRNPSNNIYRCQQLVSVKLTAREAV